MTPPGAIYDGLLAELYDDYTDADQHDDLALWSRLASDCSGPVLELASGTGRVLLPLLAAGQAVAGIDNSADMLARCRTRAATLGLAPVLYEADMTDFALDQRFGLIFCAVGSLTLLAGPGQMEAALGTARTHLAPGGLLALMMDAPGPRPAEAVIARDLTRQSDGARLLCLLDPLPDPDAEVTRWRMTNEVAAPAGTARRDTAEIAFRRPTPQRFAEMLRAAGLSDVALLDGTGTGPMRDGEGAYLALARSG